MQAATYRDDAARARAYGAVAADWARQVHAFRESVASFQRVIQRQARRRDVKRQPARSALRRPEVAPRLPVSNDRGTSNGAAELTPRQVEVAALIANGLTNRQIAAELVLTKGTVANHVEHILNKLSCHSRAQIAVWAVRQGLVAGRAS
jgi:DNA-binding NarL/FixJ family response regulator